MLEVIRNKGDYTKGIPSKGNNRSCSGFTLAEALLSLLIVVLVTTIAASGISAAFSSYRKAVDGSNAQLALSSTTAEIRDELVYATSVKVDDSTGEVEAYLSDDGYWASISSDNDGKSIVKHVYKGDADNLDEIAGSPYPLLSDAAITDNLSVAFASSGKSGIYYENGVFCVYGLEVLYGQDKVPVASIGISNDDCYKIRPADRVVEIE